jgi:hypothetical protein
MRSPAFKRTQIVSARQSVDAFFACSANWLPPSLVVLRARWKKKFMRFGWLAAAAVAEE